MRQPSIPRHFLVQAPLVGLLILLGFCALSCSSKEGGPIEPSQPPSDPHEFRFASFPLEFGNAWAYADSNLLDTPATVQLNTTSVSQYTGDGWWTINAAVVTAYSSASTFKIKSVNDTTFFAQTDAGTASPRIEYLPTPALGDTIRFSRPALNDYRLLLPVKAYLLDRPVRTPAGVFDSCVVYDSFPFPDMLREVVYFKPGIGPVMVETYSPRIAVGVVERKTLVYYNLVQ